MLRFFNGIIKRVESGHTLKIVIELNKQGKNAEALKKCTELVDQYPYDVQIRRRLAIIQKEMGKEISLPNIDPALSR